MEVMEASMEVVEASTEVMEPSVTTASAETSTYIEVINFRGSYYWKLSRKGRVKASMEVSADHYVLSLLP